MAVMACGAWCLLLWWLPALMVVERGFQRIAHGVFFSGYDLSPSHGSQPYEMLRFEKPRAITPPFVVEVGEDARQDFESIPLSPLDVSVLLDQMKELGVNRVVITSPLGWQEADPFALSALETATAALPHCVTTAAVTRAPVSDTMPPAFVRASIPLSQVRGNFRTLPVVNRLVVADSFLGQEKTWAGFSQLESESPSAQREYLIARWDDRVIFSASLLAILSREKVDPSELQIEIGKAIIAPRSGYWWAIDEFGRYQLRNTVPPKPDLLASELLRPESNVRTLLQQHTPPLHFVPHSGEEFRLLQNLAAAPILLEKLQWKRLPILAELPLMAFVVGWIAWATTNHRRKQMIVAMGWIVLFLSLFLVGSIWLPLSPLLLGLGVACGIPSVVSRKHTPVHREPASVTLDDVPTAEEAPVASKKPRKVSVPENRKESPAVQRKPEVAPAQRKKKSARKRPKK